jgi:signal transduction histidine kinase
LLDARLLELVEHLHHGVIIAVHDEAGNNIGWAGSGTTSGSRSSLADQPEFRIVMATSIPQVSEVLTLEGRGSAGIVAVVPMFDAQARPMGVVVVGTSTDQLARRYENARLLPGQAIFLADRNGRLAFHTAYHQIRGTAAELFSSSEPMRAALAGIPTTRTRFVGLAGDQQLAAFVPSHKYRWVVGVTIPRSVALAPLKGAFRSQLMAFAGIVLASLGLAAVLARFLVEPVRRLEGAAVALGHGDLSERVRIESGDEIGRLGTAFNNMAEELTHLYDQQREMLRLREDFMEAAAHELNTPLSTIKASIQLAQLGGHDPQSGRTLAIISRQTTRMTLLVEDLLTITRLRGGEPELRRQRNDLAELLRASLRQPVETSERHAITITADGPLPVDADGDLVSLVPVRLLANAVASSPEGGALEIAATREGDDAVISVIDHGYGVPADRRDHLFEPFYEPVPSGRPGYGSVVSLRLYVCKRIIDAHGGRIWFSSTPGGGSTFRFSLPLAVT